MIFTIHYKNPIYTNNLTLSIDNIVLDLFQVKPVVGEQLIVTLDKLVQRHKVEVIRWTSFKPGTFRDQFSIKLQSDMSFWVGGALNGVTTSWGRYRLEFNPNKVGDHIAFQRVLSFFTGNTSPSQRCVKRFDLAIDIPVQRDYCFLVKDRRMYIERRHGQEFTQYLGAKSSTAGRVKLYNKQIESGLEYPLTRLELTLDPGVPFEKANLPRVYYLATKDLRLDSLKVTDTERFILNALLQGYGALSDLGRKTRAKIEMLMTRYVRYIEITPQDYDSVLGQLHMYLN